MIKLIREYIKYLLIAKQRHGVHSPFVYDFGDNCIHLPLPTEIIKQFSTLKKGFLNSREVIEVVDLGAGSKKLNTSRPVRKIAKVSGSNQKYGKLLYRLVAHYDLKNVLELGTSLGLGTFMLASGNENVKVTSIEGCPNTYQFAKKHFPESLQHKVDFLNGSFVETIKNFKNIAPFDLIFIDGDHQKSSLIEQIELLAPYIHDETIIVLDDIRWSENMYEAWLYFVNHPDFHLSIDLFKMGIIMKRKHQQKEAFVIKY